MSRSKWWMGYVQVEEAGRRIWALCLVSLSKPYVFQRLDLECQVMPAIENLRLPIIDVSDGRESGMSDLEDPLEPDFSRTAHEELLENAVFREIDSPQQAIPRPAVECNFLQELGFREEEAAGEETSLTFSPDNLAGLETLAPDLTFNTTRLPKDIRSSYIFLSLLDARDFAIKSDVIFGLLKRGAERRPVQPELATKRQGHIDPGVQGDDLQSWNR